MFRKNKRAQGDFKAEIEAHLQLEIDRLREQGLSEADARAAARRTFGNRTRAEERFYESGRALWWDGLSQSVRFGLRMLRRSPASTSVAILTLALAIGANTAIFSLLNAVLLRSLPVRHPQELVSFGSGRWTGSVDSIPDGSWQLFSYHFYKQFRRENRVFSDVTALDSILFGEHGRVGSSSHLEHISTDLVSGTFFNTLGVNPLLGRLLTASDDQTPGAHPVAVASYSWWRQRLASDPGAVGTVVTINSTAYTIIGVAPPGFFGASVGQSPDLWVPLAMEKQISPGWNGLDEDLFQSLYIIARRKPGVSMASASANTNLLFHQIMRQYAGSQPTARQLADLGRARIDLMPAATGLSQIRKAFSSPLEILMAVVAVLLLIACANLANLLLARAAAREREMAIRMSIGAGRARLIRQLLVESSLLGLAGAALGVLLAMTAGRLLLSMVSTGSRPLPLNVAPDAHVLVFTLAVTVATVLLFGIAPALTATRLDLAPALKECRTVIGQRAGNRLARGLVASQVALSLVLLAGAGLFLRSLANLLNESTGFDKDNVLVMTVDPSGAGYRADARDQIMMRSVEDRVDSVPGVRAASFTFSVFDGGGWTDPVVVSGRPESPKDPEVFHNIVGAGYMRVMKIPIVLGRALEPRDDSSSPKVAVINETMARIYFPGVSPLGRTFSIGKDAAWQNIEVVGVAKDGKYMRLREEPTGAAFYPHAQHKGFLYRFVVRYTGDPASVMPRIRRAVAGVDPNLPIDDVASLTTLVSDTVANQRLVAELSTLFGALAAFLACIGIYGVMSYGVARRTNELGVRMALGAERRDILWMVLREIFALVAIGAAAGLALSLAASRLVQSAIFGLKPVDPVSLGAALLAMIAVALLAGYLPARRATHIDPMVALRYE